MSRVIGRGPVTPLAIPIVVNMQLRNGVNIIPLIYESQCLGLPEEEKIHADHKIIKGPPRPHACEKPHQVGARLQGRVFGMSHVARTCSCDFYNAMVLRHARPQPPMRHKLTISSLWLKNLSSVVRCDYVHRDSFYGFEQWITKWSAAKRAMIMRSIAIDPFQPWRVNSFPKLEGGHKVIKKARNIQAYKNLHTQAWVGYKIVNLQKAMSVSLNEDGPGHQAAKCMGKDYSIIIPSGWSSVDYARWMERTLERYPKPFFYERDGKNWDATMNLKHIDQRIDFYRMIDSSIARFCKSCVKVRGQYIGKLDRIVYQLLGTTKSGHGDTSLGNGITNAAIIFEAAAAVGIQSMRVLVMGDDLIMVTDEDFDVDALIAYEQGLGIEPIGAKLTDISKISFISAIWAQSDQNVWAFLPMPGRLCKRLFWSTKSVGKKHKLAWKQSVATGLANTCANVPIVRALLKPYIIKRKDVNTKIMTRDQFYRHKRYGQVLVPWANNTFMNAIEQRYSLVLSDSAVLACYGSPGTWIRKLEEDIALAPEECLIKDPLVDLMCDFDSLDPADR